MEFDDSDDFWFELKNSVLLRKQSPTTGTLKSSVPEGF